MATRRLLVTGFGPFPSMPRNPSGRAAKAVARSPRWRLAGIEAHALVLTTAYGALDAELGPALAERTSAVLMVGVAGRSKRIRVERQATDRRSILFPDVEGHAPDRVTGSGRRRSRRIPVAPKKLLRALRKQNLPSRLSHDAGRYLCNASFFRALGAGMPVAFIHIPKPLRPSRRRTKPRASRLSYNGRLDAALEEIARLLLLETKRAGAVPFDAGTH